MHIAFVVYDGMTALDFVGVFDPVTRLGTMGFRDDVTWDIRARTDDVTATGALTIEADLVGEPLSDADAVVVPGGIGTEIPPPDHPLVEWLHSATDTEFVAGVCTGALLLAAAGLLEDRPATTHPNAKEALAGVTAVRHERVVDAGDVVTAGGVSAAIDLGLHLCERIADADVRRAVATQMDYPYDESRENAGR